MRLKARTGAAKTRPTRPRRSGKRPAACARSAGAGTLAPLEPDLVRRLADAAGRLRWEVFFLTQRPETLGETAQRQTQRWLAAQGFDLPSVVVARGARGKLAKALGLDDFVDDTAKNCVDVVADARGNRTRFSRLAKKVGWG